VGKSLSVTKRLGGVEQNCERVDRRKRKKTPLPRGGGVRNERNALLADLAVEGMPASSDKGGDKGVLGTCVGKREGVTGEDFQSQLHRGHDLHARLKKGRGRLKEIQSEKIGKRQIHLHYLPGGKSGMGKKSVLGNQARSQRGSCRLRKGRFQRDKTQRTIRK